MQIRSKNTYRLLCVLILAALTLTLSFSVTAANTTTLTTVVPSFSSLSLQMQGNGTVTINGTPYTESARIQVERDSKMAVQIIPDNGYRLQSVVFNGENLAGSLIDGKLSLSVTEQDIILTICFSADAANPQTGDVQRYYLHLAICMLALSLIGLFFLMKHPRKKSNL